MTPTGCVPRPPGGCGFLIKSITRVGWSVLRWLVRSELAGLAALGVTSTTGVWRTLNYPLEVGICVPHSNPVVQVRYSSDDA